MQLNTNFGLPVIVQASQLNWIASPTAGVERKMLYREGDEVARATSIVRYAPGSAFPAHTHSGGEEILVLDGIFQDEHDDYPKGSYLRNPPGTSHRPASLSGCTIFVKLWQFRADDSRQIITGKKNRERTTTSGGTGYSEALFSDGHETVTLENYPSEAPIAISNDTGLEVLVLSGALVVDGQALEPLSWIRLPTGTPLQGTAGPSGTSFWIKRAPLKHQNACDIQPYLQRGESQS